MTAVLIVNAVLSVATVLVIVGGLSRAITAPRAEHPGATAPARARGLALWSRAALTHAKDGLNTERRIRRAPIDVQRTHNRARTSAHRRAPVSRPLPDRDR